MPMKAIETRPKRPTFFSWSILLLALVSSASHATAASASREMYSGDYNWNCEEDKQGFMANDPSGHSAMSSGTSIGGPTNSCKADCGGGVVMTCAGDSCGAVPGGCWVTDDGETYFWYC